MQGRGDDQNLQEAYEHYTVYDEHYEKIGRVDDLFVDDAGREQYIGVKMGLLGTRSTLIPMEIVRVNDRRRLIEIAASKSAIEDAPNFHDDEEVSRDFENRIHGYFGLPEPHPTPRRSGGSSLGDAIDPHAHEGVVDTRYGERADIPMHPPVSRDPVPSETGHGTRDDAYGERHGERRDETAFPGEPGTSSGRDVAADRRVTGDEPSATQPPERSEERSASEGSQGTGIPLVDNLLGSSGGTSSESSGTGRQENEPVAGGREPGTGRIRIRKLLR